MYRPREWACGTLLLFLVLSCGFGLSWLRMHSEGTGYALAILPSFGLLQVSSQPSMPDFSHYKHLGTLDDSDFPLDDPKRNIIVIGDIHGMIKPFRELLQKLDYSPSRDTLIHVGDVVTKGTLDGSLKVLRYLSTHNITGVRGNHDQQVVEWRGWLEWIVSLSGGRRWLERLERKWEESQSHSDTVDLGVWIEKQRYESEASEKKWWKHIPKGWKPLGDHYRIAKGMSAKDYRYLLDLPLRLYVPGAHVFIVHAGLLPSDPRYPVDDKARQPLARTPTFSDHGIDVDASSRDVEGLRKVQDVSLLTKISQNSNPWTVLNMRSVLDGKVKKTQGGTPWSNLWNTQMNSCVGFKKRSIFVDEDGAADDNFNPFIEERKAKKAHYRLPCYPSTTVYGHSAARGLDIKRWTFGLDSGCVYGRELSALIISGGRPSDKGIDDDIGQDDVDARSEGSSRGDEDFYSPSRKKPRIFSFGDNGTTRVVTTKCAR